MCVVRLFSYYSCVVRLFLLRLFSCLNLHVLGPWCFSSALFTVFMSHTLRIFLMTFFLLIFFKQHNTLDKLIPSTICRRLQLKKKRTCVKSYKNTQVCVRNALMIRMFSSFFSYIEIMVLTMMMMMLLHLFNLAWYFDLYLNI